jgi:hypothetical protein
MARAQSIVPVKNYNGLLGEKIVRLEIFKKKIEKN